MFSTFRAGQRHVHLKTLVQCVQAAQDPENEGGDWWARATAKVDKNKRPQPTADSDARAELEHVVGAEDYEAPEDIDDSMIILDPDEPTPGMVATSSPQARRASRARARRGRGRRSARACPSRTRGACP